MRSNKNMNKSKMFSEAAKRMELMNVNSCDWQTIEENEDVHFKIVVNHREKLMGREELTEEERGMIKDIEEKYNLIIYYFIQDEGIWADGCSFPRYTCLYVSRNEDEYEMVRDECILRCGTIPAYVLNMECKEYSEFAEIGVHNVGGYLINLS